MNFNKNLTILCLLLCAGSMFAKDIKVSIQPDTTTVLRNPLSGWVMYLGRTWDENFWTHKGYDSMSVENGKSTVRVSDFASTCYLRTSWSSLEPEEGKYIWNNPDSRRMLVSAWNPAEIGKMALPPCHCLFQFYVADGKLSLQLYQRSADTFLGVPFNIASYALLLQMMAQVTGLECGDFVHTTGDTHLYLNHLEQAELQLTRTPRPLPKMKINPDVKDLFSFQYEDFELTDYNPWPHIKAAVSV